MPVLAAPCTLSARRPPRPGAVALAFLLVGLGLGCQRKAPGPQDCVRFAEVWMRAHRGQVPNLFAATEEFDELVRRCLTEPYDRTLVECVVSGKFPERCRIDYTRRVEARRERAEQDEER